MNIEQRAAANAGRALGRVVAGLGLLLLAAGGSAQGPSEEPAPADGLLLKDYRPRAIHRVPRTTITRARFPIIDMHSHPCTSRWTGTTMG